ncbi:MAG: TetR/AcrR family transcriptional regulator [Pseudomonadota bacterium]
MNAEPQFKKGRKYDQVISGARDVFMREGYEGASVDEIARDAGVSKATLYSYFQDKQALFLAVLQGECNIQKKASMELACQEQDIATALHHMASSILCFLMSENGLAIFRICVAEAQRFPKLGQAFYETGPKNGMVQLSAFMASPKAQAELNISDPWGAADTFMQLCRSDLMLQRLMGVADIPDEATIKAHADEVVKTFLARYGR